MAQANFTNRTVWVGDNLQVMRGINSECIDLIYLDPPFNSNQDYAAPIGSIAAGAAFKDTWTLSDIDVHEHGELADRNPAAYSVIEAARVSHGNSAMSYLIMMAVRIAEMHRVLKPTGSIYLHCDPTMSHYLKLTMDAVFGKTNFRNELIWHYRKWPTGKYAFQRNHDVILFYSRSGSRKRTFNQLFMPRAKSTLKRFGEKQIASGYDESGRRLPSQVGDTKSPGVRQDDVWEISRVAPVKQLYPTQKPIALLERIIEASSNEGDIVFDPFCGCATTLVAADRLERQWAGIDLSALAVKLVNERISADRGALWGGANVLDQHPRRTDMGNLPNYRTHRHRLYGEQEGFCAGCDTHFPFKVMEVDHVLPKSRGGTDHFDNLQFLCTHCNKSKGSKTMAEWRAARDA